MYYSHFGLSQAPFKITPNTEFFFSGGNRGPILEALIYAIAHGEGIIKVTGEVGSGKTMLCHMLPTRLPAHIETVYIANPSVSPEEIVHAIAFDLQLAVDRAAPRLEIMQELHDFLLARHAEGKRVVVFVEESQSMPLATLEEIRLLSNLETSNDKLLQIVLFGQPELDNNLRQPNIRQLRERITHSFRLEPLTPGEIHEYLMFRMRAAGYRGPDLFANSVVKQIARASLGLTRRVNLIADKTLLAAFAENTHTVKPKHVQAAVRDSEFSQHMPRRIGPGQQLWSGAGLVAAGAAAGIIIYAVLQSASQSPATAPRMDRPVALAVPQPDANPAESTLAKPVTAAPATRRGTKPASSGVGSIKPEIAEKIDLLDARLAVTRDWLAAESETTYTIQLMIASNPARLREDISNLSKFIELNEIFVYHTSVKEKPSLTVLYGRFNDSRSARMVLDTLPESLKVNRPMLRTVRGIRAEISQHLASG